MLPLINCNMITEMRMISLTVKETDLPLEISVFCFPGSLSRVAVVHLVTCDGAGVCGKNVGKEILQTVGIQIPSHVRKSFHPDCATSLVVCVVFSLQMLNLILWLKVVMLLLLLMTSFKF